MKTKISDKDSDNDLLARYAIFLAGNRMGVEIEDNTLSEEEKTLVEEQMSKDPKLADYIHALAKSYIKFYERLDTSLAGEERFA